jgi:predicted nucleic-acid-binding protein
MTTRSSTRLLDGAVAAGEPVLVVLMCILETEWVLRSRYKRDKASIAKAFASLLETDDLRIEEEETLEEALHLWGSHSTDFADCMLAARAAQLGRTRFATFDAAAAKLPRGELIA